MFIGVVVTLLDKNIVGFELILAGVVIGSAIGIIAAKKVEMTAMPELVALFNGFGGGASAVVALGEFYRLGDPAGISTVDISTMGLSIFIGALTFTGSLIAFGKLQGMVTGQPVGFKGQQIIHALMAAASLVLTALWAINDGQADYMWWILGISFVLGLMFVMPIGGADMPVVISLLNSLSGVAASMTGFVLNNSLLIVAGTLVGASGLILTNIMCKAMNRSLPNVLFSGFGGGDGGGAAAEGTGDKSVQQTNGQDVAIQTAYAKKVIIVPGYGLAVAQAQHVLKETADLLEEKGVDVKYGIHPVAGRMPGHMNVLLAEADVPYDQLYDMEDINSEFSSADVVLIIGANDVVNPAAKTNPGSPIYGMPILNVDEAKRTIIFKRSLSPGFAGIDNELFYSDKNQMFFGDAKDSLQELVGALKNLD
jgi:NAD(P) transhydrogenase subunit beta